MQPPTDDNARPPMLRILLVTTLVAGGYLAYTYFTAEPPPEQGQVQAQTDEDPDGGEPDAPREVVDSEARQAAERRVAIETGDFTVTFSNLNTGITAIRLKRDRYVDAAGEPMQIVSVDKEQYYPFRVELNGVDVPTDAVWEAERIGDDAVRFRWEGDGVRVTRKVQAGEGPYQLWSTLTIINEGTGTRHIRPIYETNHYVTREEEEGGFFAAQSPLISSGICYWGDDEVTRIEREDALAPQGQRYGHGFGPDVLFAGVENKYFANVMATHGEPAERCQIRSENRGGTADEPHGSLFETRLLYPQRELAGGESVTYRTVSYFGPKDEDALHAAGHHLPQVVDLGWFSMVAIYLVELLRLIFGFVGNWGLAIIVMTVLVRLTLLPLTWKSFQSMARMRELKPEMDRLNDLYKDDREKKGMAVMELYRKHKISPLGGCLPQLLQMPVWFAFYASLSTNVELYHADFALWWTDLSAPDPYYVLPLTLGVLMHLQQRITPTTMDPVQAKIMMWFMPIMITSFMLFLPAGLCLYMVTNSVLGIGQQQIIYRRLKTHESDSEGEATDDEEDESDEDDDAGSGDEPAPSKSVVRRTKIKAKNKRKAARRRTRRAR